jgi:hypothetical protein
MHPPACDGLRFNGLPADWSKARGLRVIDHNCYILLARDAVGEVAGALAEDAEVWERDVLGRTVVRRPRSTFVFRLRGHPWSVFEAGPLYGLKGHEREKWLSRRLGQPVIAYGTSDTCGTIGYTLIEGGEVAEDFYAEDEGSRPAPERSWFTSARREIDLNRIENIYDFVDQFFCGQGAFDPAIESEYFFGHRLPVIGEAEVVRNPGFTQVSFPGGVEAHSTPEIERVDYVAWEQ